MSSGQQRLLSFLLKHMGKTISRDKLREIANVHDWQRSIRSLRQQGWNIKTEKTGYALISDEKSIKGKKRVSINRRLRYEILQRDNSVCQRCGRGIKDGIKLEVDHKMPVELGGINDRNNLWTLCNECNGGKKHLFSDFDQDVMIQVSKQKSGYQKLLLYFKLNKNEIIEPIKLQIISGIRDYTRTIREIRKKEKLNIPFIRKSNKYPSGGYIFTPKKK